jgi:hypothetical protein
MDIGTEAGTAAGIILIGADIGDGATRIGIITTGVVGERMKKSPRERALFTRQKVD